jgi:hypothetical protein
MEITSLKSAIESLQVALEATLLELGKEQQEKQINIAIKRPAPKHSSYTTRENLRNHCKAIKYDLAEYFNGNTFSASELFWIFEQKVELLPGDLEIRSKTRTQPKWQDNLLQAISIQLLEPDFPIKRVPGRRNVFKIEIRNSKKLL